MNNNGQLQNIDNLLTIDENIDTMSGVIKVKREDIKLRHDLLIAEIQLLRVWLGYRPIPTRSHQRDLAEIARR